MSVSGFLFSRLTAALMLAPVLAPDAGARDFQAPRTVRLLGYDGHAMEPFISPDGRWLMFNNRNHPTDSTDLHWAERQDGLTFRYRGRIAGANTSALEGTPTLDRAGRLYFVSTRSYRRTLATVYAGRWRPGSVAGVALVQGISRRRPGLLVFDVGISPDGRTLYGADGRFTGGPVPVSADLFVARRIGGPGGPGGPGDPIRFRRLAESARLLARVNTPALEYAPAISADGLELFFTRLSRTAGRMRFTIERAARDHPGAPFGASRPVRTIRGYAEAPSITADGRHLYYHARVRGRFRLFRVTRN